MHLGSEVINAASTSVRASNSSATDGGAGVFEVDDIDAGLINVGDDGN